MAKRKIKELSTEELKAKEKTLKIVLLCLLAIIFAYAATMGYLVSSGEFKTNVVTIIIPMAFIIISFATSTYRNKIFNELRSRSNG